MWTHQPSGLKLTSVGAVTRDTDAAGRSKRESAEPHLGPEVCGGTHVLVLGLGRAPGVVQLEALVAVARPAVHAALGGLLLLRRLAHVAHDGHGGAGGLPVALHDALQGEVAKQHADAALAEVDVVLAAGARDGGDPRGHRPPAPPGGGDGTWQEGRSEEGVKDPI